MAGLATPVNTNAINKGCFIENRSTEATAEPPNDAARSDVSSPVALDLLTAFLDVSEAAAGVALLLKAMVALLGHVSGLPTVVAQLFLLLLRFLTVFGDVTSSAAVVTSYGDKRM